MLLVVLKPTPSKEKAGDKDMGSIMEASPLEFGDNGNTRSVTSLSAMRVKQLVSRESWVSRSRSLYRLSLWVSQEGNRSKNELSIIVAIIQPKLARVQEIGLKTLGSSVTP